MSRLELDDQMMLHPKFIRARQLAGSEAIDLWLGIRSYCGQQLSDGFVPKYMLSEVSGPTNPKKRAAALKVLHEVGLLDPCDGGVRMHNYLKWSRSKSQVLADRERARERQARSRSPSRRDSGSDDDGSNGDSNADPSGSVTMASASASASASAVSDSHQAGARTGPPAAGTAGHVEAMAREVGASELPADWKPDAEAAAKAKSYGLDVALEADGFRAQNKRHAKISCAWDAEFLLWLHRAKKFDRPKRGSGGTRTHGGPSDDWATDADVSLRERIRGGEFGDPLRADLEAGKLDASLARRRIAELRQAEREAS